jgi:hypothetical protein
VLRQLLAIPVLFAALAFVAPSANATDQYVYEVYMYGDNMVPPVNTDAYGFVRMFFNSDYSQAVITVDVKGLSGSAVEGADIRAGPAGANGPVVKHLTDGKFSVTSAHVKFTQEDLQHIVNGDWYVAVNSTSNPDGEMRAQIQLPATVRGGAAPTPIAEPATPKPAIPIVIQPTPVPSSSNDGIRPPNTGSGGLR